MTLTNRTWLAVATGLALAVLASSSRAQDAPAPRDLVQRAIEAHGGAAALKSYPDLEMKGTSESFGRRAGRRSDIVYRERGDGAYRREMTLEFRGRKFTPVEFYDGEVRKRRFTRGWDDLPVDEAVEGARHRLTLLLDLDTAAAEALGAGTEGDRAVWRVGVPDGDGQAVLSFDQQEGYLVAIEYPGTSAAGMGTKEDVDRKVIHADFRPAGPLVLPFDVATFEDGSPVGHLRFESVEVLESFDPAWLRVPDPTRRFIPSEELAF